MWCALFASVPPCADARIVCRVWQLGRQTWQSLIVKPAGIFGNSWTSTRCLFVQVDPARLLRLLLPMPLFLSRWLRR